MKLYFETLQEQIAAKEKEIESLKLRQSDKVVEIKQDKRRL